MKQATVTWSFILTRLKTVICSIILPTCYHVTYKALFYFLFPQSLLQMPTLEEPIHQDEGGAPPFAEIPGVPWCTCGNCREMPTDLEKKCCGKEPADCVSLLPDFSRYCLDEVFIHSQDMTELGNIREPGDKNKENRYGAYKNYIYWRHGSLGQGTRLVIPSCCVWRIRDKFPDPQLQFTSFVPVM